MAFPFAALMPLAEKLLGFIPDPAARDAARAEMMKEENRADIERSTVQLSAIIEEARSQDKWTSRARPSFLYVIYILMLSAIPMGFLFAFAPEVAEAVTKGFRDWLAAIPEPIITLFGVGYLGYTGARTVDKWKD